MGIKLWKNNGHTCELCDERITNFDDYTQVFVVPQDKRGGKRLSIAHAHVDCTKVPKFTVDIYDREIIRPNIEPWTEKEKEDHQNQIIDNCIYKAKREFFERGR